MKNIYFYFFLLVLISNLVSCSHYTERHIASDGIFGAAGNETGTRPDDGQLGFMASEAILLTPPALSTSKPNDPNALTVIYDGSDYPNVAAIYTASMKPFSCKIDNGELKAAVYAGKIYKLDLNISSSVGTVSCSAPSEKAESCKEKFMIDHPSGSAQFTDYQKCAKSDPTYAAARMFYVTYLSKEDKNPLRKKFSQAQLVSLGKYAKDHVAGHDDIGALVDLLNDFNINPATEPWTMSITADGGNLHDPNGLPGSNTVETVSYLKSDRGSLFGRSKSLLGKKKMLTADDLLVVVGDKLFIGATTSAGYEPPMKSGRAYPWKKPAIYLGNDIETVIEHPDTLSVRASQLSHLEGRVEFDFLIGRKGSAAKAFASKIASPAREELSFSEILNKSLLTRQQKEKKAADVLVAEGRAEREKFLAEKIESDFSPKYVRYVLKPTKYVMRDQDLASYTFAGHNTFFESNTGMLTAIAQASSQVGASVLTKGRWDQNASKATFVDICATGVNSFNKMLQSFEKMIFDNDKDFQRALEKYTTSDATKCKAIDSDSKEMVFKLDESSYQFCYLADANENNKIILHPLYITAKYVMAETGAVVYKELPYTTLRKHPFFTASLVTGAKITDHHIGKLSCVNSNFFFVDSRNSEWVSALIKDLSSPTREELYLEQIRQAQIELREQREYYREMMSQMRDNLYTGRGNDRTTPRRQEDADILELRERIIRSSFSPSQNVYNEFANRLRNAR